jgi:hypothetical protein
MLASLRYYSVTCMDEFGTIEERERESECLSKSQNFSLLSDFRKSKAITAIMFPGTKNTDLCREYDL